MEKKKLLVLAGMILAAAFTRLIPHYPNFTAVGAMALFGGAYFENKKLAFIVPLAALFLTDLLLGFHSTMFAVYLSFLLIVMIGFGLRNNKKVLNIGLASVSASVLFFVITNFAAWATMPFYAKDFNGLIQAYVAAVPFFHYNLLGDLMYAGIMFGGYELLKVKVPALAGSEA